MNVHLCLSDRSGSSENEPVRLRLLLHFLHFLRELKQMSSANLTCETRDNETMNEYGDDDVK